MGSWTKLLVALLVTLPIGGYVAGTLISTTPQDQGPRQPVVLRDATPSPNPSPTPTKAAAPPPAEDAPDEVRVLTPAPTRVGDDDGDDGPGTDERDDDDGDDDSGDDSSEGGDD
jgi:hypothetical protein